MNIICCAACVVGMLPDAVAGNPASAVTAHRLVLRDSLLRVTLLFPGEVFLAWT
jgi:hypothetical protein